MNENPGETPNPLNPNPVDDPGSNGATPDAVEDASAAQTEQVDPLMQATAGITDQPDSDPLSRPMEQAPAQEPAQPKKKKTGLIIGIVIALLVAIICGVVAAIMLMNQGDPVSKAVSKLMEGNAPTNVAIDGTIDVTPIDSSSVLTGLKIDLKVDATTSSMINHATATVTASLQQLGDLEIDVEEMYAENGDLFLKVDGLTEAIEKVSGGMLNTTTTTNCIDDETGMTNCGPSVLTDCEDLDGNVVPCDDDTAVDLYEDESGSALDLLGGYSGIIELIDGEWLRVSVDELKAMTESMNSSSDNALTCLTDLATEAKDNKNSIAEMYRKNPFIGSTTENVSIASKNSTVYRVIFDREKFNNYSKEIKDSTMVKKAISCLGEDNVEVSSNADETLNKLPNIYVEVDKDDNFSRVYFETTVKSTSSSSSASAFDESDESVESVEKDVANMKVDLGLTYPSTINVVAPTEYQDLMTVLQQVFMSMDY